VGGVARAAGGAVAQGVRSTAGRASSSLRESVDTGRRAAWAATGGQPIANGAPSSSSTGTTSAPDWAKSLRTDQTRRAHAHATAQSIKDGDRSGAPANPDLSSKDE
jgi:type IV secretion system protein TrbL